MVPGVDESADRQNNRQNKADDAKKKPYKEQYPRRKLGESDHRAQEFQMAADVEEVSGRSSSRAPSPSSASNNREGRRHKQGAHSHPQEQQSEFTMLVERGQDHFGKVNVAGAAKSKISTGLAAEDDLRLAGDRLF